MLGEGRETVEKRVQAKGGRFIVSNIKTNPQQVVITGYCASAGAHSAFSGLMLNDVTVQEWRTSRYCFLYLLVFEILCLSLGLKDEPVQYPAAERDPVARPAQLGPLLNGVMGYIILRRREDELPVLLRTFVRVYPPLTSSSSV